jgi:hypothetical protein
MLQCSIIIRRHAPIFGPSKPDISPDWRWRVPMKNLMLAAFAALSLTAGIAPMAHAFTTGFPQTTQHSGPYDNTANSEGGRFAGTAGGN